MNDKKETVIKKRGFLLTSGLLISFFGTLTSYFQPLQYENKYWESQYYFVPFWFSKYLIFSSILTLIGLLAMWKWKKWGFYLVLINSLVSTLILIYMRHRYIFVTPFILIFSFIWIFIILRKRTLFD